MTYGVRTFSESGVVELDTDSFTYQVLHNQTYNLAVTPVVTVTVSGFNAARCSAVILPISASGSLSLPHNALPYMSISGSTITVMGGHPRETDGTSSTIQFRLLVMRFRN